MHKRTAIGCAAAFAVLAVLVAHGGAVHRIDAWAVHHVMPGINPGSRAPSVGGSLVPLRHVSAAGRSARIRLATNLWTFPASAGVSALLFAGGALLFLRRGNRRAALLWAGLWLAGNAIEVLCKSTIERPPLFAFVHGVPVHLAGFDNSYPSGHTLRSLLLAGLLAALWHRARGAAFIWAALAVPLLVLAGFHTPSDVVGGALLAGLLLALAS
jgi:membrane-associated phospholipid phosphatase